MHDWFSGLHFALCSLRRVDLKDMSAVGLFCSLLRCVLFDLRQAPDSQFLGVVLDMPVVVHVETLLTCPLCSTTVLVVTEQTVESRSCSSMSRPVLGQVANVPVVVVNRCVETVQKTVEVRQLPFDVRRGADRGIVPQARVARVRWCHLAPPESTECLQDLRSHRSPQSGC